MLVLFGPIPLGRKIDVKKVIKKIVPRVVTWKRQILLFLKNEKSDPLESTTIQSALIDTYDDV